MNLHELVYEEWDSIKYSRKLDALKKVVEALERDEDEELLYSILEPLTDAEQDDYFGTEGLRF